MISFLALVISIGAYAYIHYLINKIKTELKNGEYIKVADSNIEFVYIDENTDETSFSAKRPIKKIVKKIQKEEIEDKDFVFTSVD